MNWWIYKCNNRQHPQQVCYGDWHDFFDEDRVAEWGSNERVPALEQLNVGDRVIAYQTDRNELVGVARVESFRRRKSHLNLYLEPVERIGVKVLPLKNLTQKSHQFLRYNVDRSKRYTPFLLQMRKHYFGRPGLNPLLSKQRMATMSNISLKVRFAYPSRRFAAQNCGKRQKAIGE